MFYEINNSKVFIVYTYRQWISSDFLFHFNFAAMLLNLFNQLNSQGTSATGYVKLCFDILCYVMQDFSQNTSFTFEIS